MSKQMRKPATKRSRSSKSKLPLSVKRNKLTYRQVAVQRPFLAMNQMPITGSNNKKQHFVLNFIDKRVLNATTTGLSQGIRTRINSIFDVIDGSGFDEQPSGYDELSTMFEHYRVYRVDYKVSINNLSANDRGIAGVTVCDADPGAIVGINWRRLVESGGTQWKYVGRQADGEQAPSLAEFSGTVDLPKLNGKTWKEYFADDTFRGSFGANTPDVNFLLIWYQPMQDTLANGMDICYELNFHVEVDGNKLLQLSS